MPHFRISCLADYYLFNVLCYHDSEVRGEIMDIIRQITLVYPVETFVFGADWLLQRATLSAAANSTGKLTNVYVFAPSEC